MLGANILFVFKVIIQLQKSFQNEKYKVTLKFTYLYISDCFHYIPVYFLCANLVNYTIYDVTEREAAAFYIEQWKDKQQQNKIFRLHLPFRRFIIFQQQLK